jgi:hypothetical protein
MNGEKTMEAYLKNNPFFSEQKDVQRILDYLVLCYLEEHPVASENIKAIQKEITPYFEDTPFEASNHLFRLVYDLCGAYEDAAFREGFKVGLHLCHEIGKE